MTTLLQEIKERAHKEYATSNESEEDYFLSILGEEAWALESEYDKNTLLRNLCWFVSNHGKGKEFLKYLEEYEGDLLNV